MTQGVHPLLLVGCGVMGEPYLRAARRLGLPVALVDAPARLEELRSAHDVVIDGEAVPTETAAHEEAWVERAETLAARHRIAGVVGFSEPQVIAASLVQERYGLPGPGLAAAVLSRNKAMQRSVFTVAGLGQPDHRFAPRIATATDWARERLPVVVKPLDRAGSEGVELVTSADRWAEVVGRREGDGPLMVEEYVEAQEYSWEALVSDGRVLLSNLTHKTTTGAPHFVELLHRPGHEQAAPALMAAADELGARIVAAAGVSTAMMCVEFRARRSELAIMEFMVRMPGDHLMEALARTLGIDLFAAHLELALGRAPSWLPLDEDRPRARPAVARRAASLFLVAEADGILDRLDLRDLDSVPAVARYGASACPGAAVRRPRASAERLAYIVLDAADDHELEAALDAVRARRRVHLRAIPAATAPIPEHPAAHPEPPSGPSRRTHA